MIMYCPELNRIAVIFLSINCEFEDTYTVTRWISDENMGEDILENYDWHFVCHI